MEKKSEEILPKESRLSIHQFGYLYQESPIYAIKMRQYHEALESAESEIDSLRKENERIFKKTLQDIKDYVKSLDTPENEVYQKNSLLIMSCFSKAMEIIEKNNLGE